DRRQHRVGVEDAGQASDEVVGIERGSGDMAEGALMGVAFADDRVGGALGQLAHHLTSLLVAAMRPSCSAEKRSSEDLSIAVRYFALVRWSSIGVPWAARVSAAACTVSRLQGLPSSRDSVDRARSGVAATPPRPIRALVTVPS